jgi:hypothetical protein
MRESLPQPDSIITSLTPHTHQRQWIPSVSLFTNTSNVPKSEPSLSTPTDADGGSAGGVVALDGFCFDRRHGKVGDAWIRN